MAGIAGLQHLCDSADLVERGRGLRFTVNWQGRETPAFAIRCGGQVRAYLNRCGHMAVELDWEPGNFFDSEGDMLVCATHGALYHPLTGACISGRCQGTGLVSLAVRESGQTVHLVAQNDVELLSVTLPGKSDDTNHTTGR